jgi:ElaA protein
LRERIFVVEQNCAYLDCDGKDFDAWHCCLYDNQNLVAYTRLVPDTHPKHWHIGRVVVAENYRGNDLGKMIMRKSIEILDKQMKSTTIELSAQVYLKRFYSELGFCAVGQ